MFRFASRKDLNSEPLKCTITLFDEEELLECEFSKEDKGQFLLDMCCKNLDLIEKDYFGLLFVDERQQPTWLDTTRYIVKQVKGLSVINLSFRVKFYPADPSRLKEEITRYYLFRQIRRDLQQGRLQCSSNDLPLLMAYIVQSELGDYDPDKHDTHYISSLQLVPNQTPDLEKTVAEIHQKDLKGRSTAEAEMLFLRRASSLDMYGVDPHNVKDHKGKQICIGVNHLGISTFQGNRRAQTFKWSEIEKLTYEGRMFIFHASPSDKKKVLGFKCKNSSACHHLWRCVVEHRYFFTMSSSSEIPSVTTGGGIFKTYKLRYAGRVEKEVIDDMKKIDRKEVTVKRSFSSAAVLSRLARSNTILSTHTEREQESTHKDSFEGKENDLAESSASTPDMPGNIGSRSLMTNSEKRFDGTTNETHEMSESPSSNLKHNHEKVKEKLDGENYLLKGEFSSTKNQIEDKPSTLSKNSKKSHKAYLIIKNTFLTSFLLLLLVTCFFILIIEFESDLFSTIRKNPEITHLRTKYYEPIKNSILSKAYDFR
ncbi:FERM domain-containing protein 5-like [Brevipalpus obovatus]|uniref:FERM domain-containing protein 5-like n=1 Tax=Brevipalpus obovatus TaxID=246614 RepID=UPI003D9EA81A